MHFCIFLTSQGKIHILAWIFLLLLYLQHPNLASIALCYSSFSSHLMPSLAKIQSAPQRMRSEAEVIGYKSYGEQQCNACCRVATAGKAGKVWSLPRFWVSIFSYKKQPVKTFLGRILDPSQLKFAVVALCRALDIVNISTQYLYSITLAESEHFPHDSKIFYIKCMKFTNNKLLPNRPKSE